MPSFGERLKREREQRGITLDDICVSTKISTRLLLALEEDRFHELPGGIFNKGFVRAYARHLRLDEDDIVAEYLEASGEAPRPVLVEPPEVPAEPASKPQRSSDISWRMFAALVVLAIIGFVALRHYPRQQPSDAVSAPPTTTPARQSIKPGTTSAIVVPAAKRTSGRFTVQIKAREDCWLSVTADGKPAVEYTLAGPSEKTIQADDLLVIKAGNVGALDLFFDGKRVPSQGDYGEVKTLAFDANGLRPLPQAAAAGLYP